MEEAPSSRRPRLHEGALLAAAAKGSRTPRLRKFLRFFEEVPLVDLTGPAERIPEPTRTILNKFWTPAFNETDNTSELFPTGM